MGVKSETYLQRRIKRLIRLRGGYCVKNWGSMISEPGIADITACYKGLYIALEVKDKDNKPEPAQGIHARNVQKAGGITAAVWSVEEVEKILNSIDCLISWGTSSFAKVREFPVVIKKKLAEQNIDDGTRY